MQEGRKWASHGTRCNDWIACFFFFYLWNKNSVSILELTSWHAFPMQNSIQTTLCLSYKVRESFSFAKKKDGTDRAGWKKKACLKFAVSTLASWETPPMLNAIQSPLVLLNPSEKTECGPPLYTVRWTESGGWCYVSFIRLPSFGCLNLSICSFKTVRKVSSSWPLVSSVRLFNRWKRSKLWRSFYSGWRSKAFKLIDAHKND